MNAQPQAADREPRRWIVVAVVAILLSAAAFRLFLLAWRNLKQQRGDRTGAFRVGAAVFWISLGEWLLAARHSLTVREASLAADAVSWALVLGALACMGYLAVDPVVRRLYPQLLISLQKILTGARRDAQVGRDVLWGLGLAVGFNLLAAALTFSIGERTYGASSLTLRDLAALWLGDLRLGTWFGLLALAFIIPLRSRLKRRLRFGALSIIVAETGLFCLKDLPGVPDASAWYAQAPLLGYAGFAAVAIYAARLSAGTGEAMRELR